jgi:hypothetical protein
MMSCCNGPRVLAKSAWITRSTWKVAESTQISL